MKGTLKKPEWIKTRIPAGKHFQQINALNQHTGLATVCEEARCPNQWECWKEGTATFMLMGDTCTRSCRFCSVKTARHPSGPDPMEPDHLAETIRTLQLKYAVLTTVDRDDLSDYGAGHILTCVDRIKAVNPSVMIELLVPDFQGDETCIRRIAESQAEVVGHNLECTRRLTQIVRDPRAGYEQSLQVLKLLSQFNPTLITKSSLMLGFGETDDEVLEAMGDILGSGVEILTLGQYLQPGKHNIPVAKYVHPDKFEWFREQGLKMGFEYIAAGPLVRSSYMAAEHYLKLRLSRQGKS